ncbi:MAG: hypothetical protein DRP11_03445 [Candidatus Aenigmatarchaeota archaeon]|nr:MAG: hypothetical protein DRP11_03445 [Candidatus Aenigmarchaeota archaeon]
MSYILDIGGTIVNALTSFYEWVVDAIRGFIDWLVTQTNTYIIQPIYNGLNTALTHFIQRIDRILFVLNTVPIVMKTWDELITKPTWKTAMKLILAPIVGWAKGYFVKKLLTTYWGETPQIQLPQISMPTTAPKLPPYYLKYVDATARITSAYQTLLTTPTKASVDIESLYQTLLTPPSTCLAEIGSKYETYISALPITKASVESLYQTHLTVPTTQLATIQSACETSLLSRFPVTAEIESLYQTEVVTVTSKFNAYGDTGNDYPWDISHPLAVDSEGNIYVVGRTNSFGVAQLSPIIIKLDSELNVVWCRVLDLGDDGEFFSVCVGGDGYIYACGRKGTYAITAKFSPDGELLACKEFTGMKQLRQVEWYSYTDELVLTGVDMNTRAISFFEYTDLSPDIWGGMDGVDGYGVHPKPNGEYTIVGTRHDIATPRLWVGVWDTKGGNCTAKELYDVDRADSPIHGRACRWDGEGNLIVVGKMTNTLNKAYVFKLSLPDFTVLWARRFTAFEVSDVDVDSEGNIYIAATLQDPSLPYQVLIVKIDKDGNLIFSVRAVGTSDEYACGVRIGGKGFIMAGALTSWGAGGYDFGVGDIAPDGSFCVSESVDVAFESVNTGMVDGKVAAYAIGGSVNDLTPTVLSPTPTKTVIC